MTPSVAPLLLVDDEEINRDMLSRRLELHGYRVTAVESGTRALALAAQQSFEVVLLDIMMPELSGLETLKRLRARHDAAELPIIMVTAKSQSEDVVQALALGANDYVTKPIDFAVALARIATQVAHRRAQASLRESETRYALAARGANDGLWDWDLTTAKIYYSPRWKAMLGHDENEVGAEPDEWFRRVHGEDQTALQAALTGHREGQTPHFEHEHRMLHKDGGYRWVRSRGVAVRNAAGQAIRMAGSLTDITEGKVADALTGLPNRVLFLDRLGRAMTRCHRNPNYHFAVLFLDLDGFKVINDSLGHGAGDQLLVGVSRRLEACVRGSDTVVRLANGHTVARLGGDEFTILLEDIDGMEAATRVAERLQKELAMPFAVAGHEVFTRASIGIVQGAAAYDRPEDLLRDADIAMYSAKARGKDGYAVFDAAMRERAMARLELESDLRQALDRGEFFLHYQPILALDNERIAGFEALLRWQHPRRGFISPQEFIPVAEETGIILPLGLWVLRQACRQMSTWQASFGGDPPLMISVNFSGKQFAQPDLVEQIQEVLVQEGLPTTSLKMEITESVIMDNPVAAVAMLARLRALGIQIGIDDFGTGYSSLSYLHRFPIDTLKIDRSFVNKVSSGGENVEMVRTIVAMAHALKIDVIAEGVETAEQQAVLTSLDCEYGQGYYFSRPVPPEAAESLLQRNLSPGGVSGQEVDSQLTSPERQQQVEAPVAGAPG